MKRLCSLLVAVIAASSCSSDASSELGASTTTTDAPAVEAVTATTASTESTTTTIPLPVAPYTGLPFEGDEAALQRPAIVVKVDNHPRSRPQTGLDRADMVIELRAEGVTRFMAVYHSDLPEPVGPVRSARTSDFDILTALDEPAFAYSGANAIVDRGLGALPIYARYENRTDFFRARNRNAPHNLYVNPVGMQASLPDDAKAPEPWFTFADIDTVIEQGRSISGDVTVVFQGSPIVRYRWDNELGGWLRTQDGATHSTESGDQLAPANVVILETTYGVSRADAASPELLSVGFGAATILTAGRVIQGTWSRTDNTVPPEISDIDGRTIVLAPGQTWVEWPDRSVIIPES
ncbi:MAG: DUF3048 domain-containing protein [Acidimicrobiales bacterium]|nr:DUF3048 domain-containing protein [Acidimicrobiales bacterium]